MSVTLFCAVDRFGAGKKADVIPVVPIDHDS